MLIKLNDTGHFPFSLRDPTTGNAVDAAVLPTAAVYETSNLTPLGSAVVNVIKLTATGQYSVSVVVQTATGFDVGSQYAVRVNATVGTVTDETQVGTFQVSAENHGLAIDKTLGSIVTDITTYGDSAWTTADVPTVAEIWAYTDTIGSTKTAFEILCMAAVGAGAGVVDTTATPGVTRNETFRYFDGTDAFIVAADEDGNRQTVNLNP